MAKKTKRFTLDGETIDIVEFIADNGFDRKEIRKIAKLKVGDELLYGGGAAAEFILKRTA
jgi:uncharacterized protein (UPF0335 family)